MEKAQDHGLKMAHDPALLLSTIQEPVIGCIAKKGIDRKRLRENPGGARRSLPEINSLPQKSTF